MNFLEFLLSFFEILGTISFAISGAITAIEQKLDILGIAIVGTVTALGGGITRDIIMGRMPPSAFLSYSIIILSIAVSLLFYVFNRICTVKKYKPAKMFVKMNYICDTIGLGTFSVIGVQLGMESSYHNNMFIPIFLGVLTGVGGGILRDVLCNKIPSVFHEEIYATASIVGSAFYYIMYRYFNTRIMAPFICIAIVMIIRFFSTKHNLRLPKPIS